MSSIVLDRSHEQTAPGVLHQARWRIYRAVLILSDIVTLVAAFAISYTVRFYTEIPLFEEVQLSLDVHLRLLPFVIFGWVLILAAFRLYDVRNLLGGIKEYSSLFNACAVATCLLIMLTFFVPIVRLSRGALVLAWLLAFAMLSAERFVARRVVYAMRRRGLLSTRALIVGTDDEAHAIAHQIQDMPTHGARVLGFVADTNTADLKTEGGLPILGTIDTLPQLVERLGIEELIVSTATLPRAHLISIFQNFANSERVELRLSSGLYELFTTGVTVKELGNVPLVSMNKVRLNEVETVLKTLIDKLAALALLVLLSPLFLVIAIAIKLNSPGPVFHRRHVLGRGGQEFDAFKFRTMYVNGAEILAQHPELASELQANEKLKQDPRITSVGHFLRRFSLDEFPQLFNILVGQMSLVGPRMITPAEAAKYGKWKWNLLTVKPGLTGLWQVKGRSDVSYDERVRFDMYYIRNYSIWLDIQILFQTIPAVVSGKGAY